MTTRTTGLVTRCHIWATETHGKFVLIPTGADA